MSEHTEQTAVFDWAGTCQWKDSFERLLFTVPGESGKGLRAMLRSKKMKAEGYKKGTPDIFLATPSQAFEVEFYGLFIEMKDHRKYLQPEQKAAIRAFRDEGYAAFCCQGGDAAIELIKVYMADPTVLDKLARAEKESLYYKPIATHN